MKILYNIWLKAKMTVIRTLITEPLAFGILEDLESSRDRRTLLDFKEVYLIEKILLLCRFNLYS